jgi:hypothetical protein
MKPALLCAGARHSRAGRREQMRTDPEQFGHSFKGASSLQHHATIFIIGEACRQVIEQICRAFHTYQVKNLKAAGSKFGSQLAGPVHVTAKGTWTERR